MATASAFRAWVASSTAASCRCTLAACSSMILANPSTLRQSRESMKLEFRQDPVLYPQRVDYHALAGVNS